MGKIIKEVLGWLLWILISPLVLIGLLYLLYIDVKQKAEWSESWNNYKPNDGINRYSKHQYSNGLVTCKANK